MKSLNNKSRSDGYKWGTDFAKKERKKTFRKAEEDSISRLTRIADVCYGYATNEKIRKTKKGTLLTNDKRDFYEGVFLGISNNLFK